MAEFSASNRQNAALIGSRGVRLRPKVGLPRFRWLQHFGDVAAPKARALAALGQAHADALAGDAVANEDHPALVAGDAVAAVGDVGEGGFDEIWHGVGGSMTRSASR